MNRKAGFEFGLMEKQMALMNAIITALKTHVLQRYYVIKYPTCFNIYKKYLLFKHNSRKVSNFVTKS